MPSDTFSISSLRAHAAELRRQAGEIDATADRVEKLMSQIGSIAPVERRTVEPQLTPGASLRGGSKGKPAGTLNMSWRDNFASIADRAGDDEFPLDLVRDIVRERKGADVKLSALRRQFKDYTAHGWVQSNTTDTYRLTDKLKRLIGAFDTAASTLRNENEASAADAADASETALAAQDGRPQE